MQNATNLRLFLIEFCLVLAELYKFAPDQSPSRELTQRIRKILKDKKVLDGFREGHGTLWNSFAYSNPQLKPENFSYSADDIEDDREYLGGTLSGILFDLPLVSAALGLDHASQFQKAKAFNAKVRKSYLARKQREAAKRKRKATH